MFIQRTQTLIKAIKLSKNFSTSRVYPDQIVDHLKTVLSSEHVNDSKWLDIETKLFENINFFDADQFVDTVSLIAYADKGTESLWDMISRKIFDYDLDIPQTYMLNESLKKCHKYEYFFSDNIARNNIVYDVKWPVESKVFQTLL